MSAHFTHETMRFLQGLAKNNDRTWFEARRPTYESALKEPLHQLIEEINQELAGFAPEHIRPPHKIAMRIFRDTRFSPDKRPYTKTTSRPGGRARGSRRPPLPASFCRSARQAASSRQASTRPSATISSCFAAGWPNTTTATAPRSPHC